MMYRRVNRSLRRVAILALVLLMAGLSGSALAHPLGNFTINHFARIEAKPDAISIRYVIDMAEIPAFQELQAIDTDQDGTPSNAELEAYAERAAAQYAEGLSVTVEGTPLRLNVVSKNISLPPGMGGLPTLRIECDFRSAALTGEASAARRVRFEDNNFRDRAGWRETVAAGSQGVTVYDSTAFGNAVTDELQAYPEDLLAAPLDERAAEFSFTRGAIPAGAAALKSRDGKPVAQSRDRLAELIAVPEVTLPIALFGLLIAAGLGALHALSPGHGKAVVGAYLVGSRGTPKHAAFLGLTVTITHTLGVFALGLVTLFAAQYVLPERLFPILSFVSGLLVLGIGLSLFIQRLRTVGASTHEHHHTHSHEHHDHAHDHHEHPREHHEHAHAHSHHHHGQAHHHTHDHHHHTHAHDHSHEHVHSHGGRPHSHLPPGGDGSPVTWRSLLALGISGGLLPCPSALVVLLSAISLHRVGYGLLLVVAFSFGLAATLTAVGLLFLYAGRLLKRPDGVRSSRFVRLLPAVSALVITCIGAVICYQALSGTLFQLDAPFSGLLGFFTAPMNETTAISSASLLGLGLLFGLKHAIEADHVAAVATIVSERKSVLSSSLVGGFWGLGHTISLLLAGVVVLLLRIEISDKTALALEFCVALMLIGLGVNAIRKILRGDKLHMHAHAHGGRAHIHPHIHDSAHEADEATHHGLRPGLRPMLVGMVHGLAGSAALMLLVLSTINSTAVGFLYIIVFGVGSIGGMVLMSALVSLPVQFTASRFEKANKAVRLLAGVFSLAFGVFLAYEIGFVEGLFS
ncbi:MAG TPA: hypothetical protein VNO70_08120 [Blastocatellia bacterium]|nr:hypothetical protein [Blastocatellia bacterium]